MKAIKNLFFLIFIFIQVQKGINSLNIYEAEAVKGKVWEKYRKDLGTYYIAYSPYSKEYTRITSFVTLPYSVETKGGKRNAFISFGILGKYGYIDMGIMKNGTGWKPFYNDNGDLIYFDDFTAKEDVEIMGVEIGFKSEKKVYFAVSFRYSDKDSIPGYKLFWKELYVSHILERNEEGKPLFRFYRFVSLVNDKDNGVPNYQKDGTSLINSVFNKLVIMVNNAGKTWGIDGPNIEACFPLVPGFPKMRDKVVIVGMAHHTGKHPAAETLVITRL